MCSSECGKLLRSIRITPGGHFSTESKRKTEEGNVDLGYNVGGF